MLLCSFPCFAEAYEDMKVSSVMITSHRLPVVLNAAWVTGHPAGCFTWLSSSLPSQPSPSPSTSPGNASDGKTNVFNLTFTVRLSLWLDFLWRGSWAHGGYVCVFSIHLLFTDSSLLHRRRPLPGCGSPHEVHIAEKSGRCDSCRRSRLGVGGLSQRLRHHMEGLEPWRQVSVGECSSG